MKILRKSHLHYVTIAIAVWIVSFTFISSVYADDTPPLPPEPSTGESQTDINVAENTTSPMELNTDTVYQPEVTDMVVLNDSETILPTATHNIQEIISTADPIWCPAGVKPIASTNGCTISYPNLSSLVSGYTPTKSGTIWIENTTDTGTEVLMDGNANWAAAKNFNLTLQGGWTLAPSLNAISGNSTFNNAINIVNWNGNIAVNNILFNNVSGNTASPETAALYIETSKNIKIANLTANNTSGLNMSGVYLDNRASSQGNSVTITNAVFDSNNYYGLQVNSDGAVTLNNIIASNTSTYGGVSIFNNYDTVSSPVVVRNSEFLQNPSEGLYILSNGTVTLDSLNVIGNKYGVFINNRDGHGNVLLLNTNKFFGNTESGIIVKSNETVSINHIIANNNWVGGSFEGRILRIINSGEFINNTSNGLMTNSGYVFLNNITSIGNGDLGAQIGFGTNLVISGSANFSNNGETGIRITANCNTCTARVTIANITANNNGYDGINFQGYIEAPYIFISGSLTANSNTLAGLNATAINLLSANNLTTNNNGEEGTIFMGDKIILSGTNNFLNNGNEGLSISAGSILLKNINANSNGSSGDNSGVRLYGIIPTESPYVVISGVNSFNFNALHGLEIYSNSALTLSNITAINNGHNVVDGLGSGVFIENISTSTARPIIINGVNNFNYNEQDGLHIDSTSYITISNIIATNNGLNGADLDNSNAIAQYTIKVLGYGIFEENGANGLSIESNGAITTYNLRANNNLGNGAYINTQGITSPQFATLYGVNNFADNGNGTNGSGLVIFTDGNITINKITSSSNTESGAILDNFTNWNSPLTPFTTFGSVTIKGYGTFNSNGLGDGLQINTNGSALITQISSVLNGNDITDHGILIAAGKGTTLTCSSAYNNSGYGLFITLPNTAILRLQGFFAHGNTGPNETLSGILIRTSCP